MPEATMCSLSRLRIAFASLLILAAAMADVAGNSLSVYQVLESYGYPVGLLPKGVTGYELDPSTGKFAVYLSETCTFTIQGYDLKYKTKITGTVTKDRIRNIKGIQVKILILWVNIAEVIKDGDEVDFSVGIASASFPIDNFYESPQCGCGFDCVSGRQSGGFSFERLGVPPQILDI